MSQTLFLVSVFIAFILLITHSIKNNGKKHTIRFFGVGLSFTFLRELFYATFISKYSFPNLSLVILDVPIAIPIGWVFTFYLAHEFTKKLIKVYEKKSAINFIIITSIFSNFICIPIETAAMNMNWWELGSTWIINDNIAPVGLMSGWWYTSVIFFDILFVIQKKLEPKNLLLAVFLFTSVILIEMNKSYFQLEIYMLVIFYSLLAIGMAFLSREVTLIGILFVFLTIILPGLISFAPNSMLVMLTFFYDFIVVISILLKNR